MNNLIRQVGWALLIGFALLAAINALLFILDAHHGDIKIKVRFLNYPLAAQIHMIGGIVAILVGPFQFLKGIRKRWPNLHKSLGCIYLLAVWSSAVGGLYFSAITDSGLAISLGFGSLAICWIWSAIKAVFSIMLNQIQAHRKWMIRNYALTFSAATLRLELPLLLVMGLEKNLAFALVSWLCWLLNLVFVEAWFYRKDLLKESA